MAIKYLSGNRIQGTNAERLALTDSTFPDAFTGLGADTNSVPTVDSSTPIYGQDSLDFDPPLSGSFSSYIGSIGGHTEHGGSADKWNDLGAGDFAIAFWLKYTATQGAEGGSGVDTSGIILNDVNSFTNPNNNGFSIGLDDGDTAKFLVHYSVGGGASSDVIIDQAKTGAIAPQEDKWHFYVFNFDNSGNTELKIYRDGESPDSDYILNYGNTVTATSGNTSGLDLGRLTANNSRGFIGSLNDISIWERNLTEAEINAMFNGYTPATGSTATTNTGKNVSDSGIDTTGCLAWWKCEDKTTGSDGFPNSAITSYTYPDLVNGTIFNETDTYKYFMFDGTDTWNQMVSS